MNEEEQWDLKIEKCREEDDIGKHDCMMNKDEEYALTHLGLFNIHVALETLSVDMAKHGHELSVKDLLKELGEI